MNFNWKKNKNKKKNMWKHRVNKKVHFKSQKTGANKV